MGLLHQLRFGPRAAGGLWPGGKASARPQAIHAELSACRRGMKSGPGFVEPRQGGRASGGAGGASGGVRRGALRNPLELVPSVGLARSCQRIVELVGWTDRGRGGPPWEAAYHA